MELNLDDFASPRRTVTVKGKVYEVQDISVEAFIESQKEAKAQEDRAAAGDPPSLAEQLQAVMKVVHWAVPSMPMEVIRGLNLAQLTAISRFVRNVDPSDAGLDEGEEGVDAEGNKKK